MSADQISLALTRLQTRDTTLFPGCRYSGERDGALKPYRFLPLGTPSANSLALLPDGKTIVVGVGDAGVAFINVQDAIDSKAVPYFAGQGADAGTFDVVSSPDGKYVFSSNEYGVIGQSRGNIGIVAVHADSEWSGRPSGNHRPTGNRRCCSKPCSFCRRFPAFMWQVSLCPRTILRTSLAAGNSLLTKGDCVQRKGTPARPMALLPSSIRSGSSTGQRRASSVLSRVAAGVPRCVWWKPRIPPRFS